MTVVVPAPVPLEWPPGDPAALEDFVEDVAGTAYRLAVVSTCLTSSSASAPTWHGADAFAAAAQIGVVATLAETLSSGVAAAASRLRAHHDEVVRTRQRITALRAQQDEDFRAAWGRLSRIGDYHLAVMTDGSAAVAIVDELEAAEAARRREHGRLLEELADDAAATARVLAEACRGVGGTGHRGDSGQVVAHLAAFLPGWGEAELHRLGVDLAGNMSGLLTLGERESLARQAAPYAGSPAFAATFLARLGEDGVRQLLTMLGDGDLGPESALARTLALALGAADPPGTAGHDVARVLAATYVDTDDVGTYPDLVALGMGTVLRAGGAAGPRGATVRTWSRQILAREHAQGGGLTGARAVDRATPVGKAVDPADPMEAVAARLARIDDPASAAALLRDRPAWDGLLSRSWDDGGTRLAMLVTHAGTASGGAGEQAVRAGLEALGAGLADGDPADWTVDRATAASAAPALGKAVAANLAPVTGALEHAADGGLRAREADLLRGLGYLTLDEGAARAIEEGLQDRVVATPGASGEPVVTEALVAVSGFVAIREYGQRLAYALHGFEEQAAAEARERSWNWSWGLLPNLVRHTAAGVVLGLAADHAAILLDRDGTWENGPDTGTVFSAQDAGRAALRSLPSSPLTQGAAIDARAGQAFESTVDAVGRPKPPTPPATDWLEPWKNVAGGLVADRVGDRVKGPLGTVVRRSPVAYDLAGDPADDPESGD